MRWRDALTLAVESVTRRFGRTALTVLAVALASALLVALTTIVVTANSRVLRQVSKGGPITAVRVLAARAQPGQLDSDDFRSGEPVDLDREAVERIRALPAVAAVAPVLVSDTLAIPPEVPDGPERIFERMVGVDLSQPENLPVTVLAGRLPAPGLSNEVAVTLGYLDRLRLDADEPEQVVGTFVDLGAAQVYRKLGGDLDYRGRWVHARIVGVVAQDAGPGQFLVPIEQTQADRTWALRGIGDGERQPLPTSDYTGLVVVASTLDRVRDVRAAITELGYATSAPEQLIANVQRYLRVVDIVLGAIALIALVIASLGIANALLAAVRERRREIGVLKAIGARDRDVLRTFLLEAGFVGAIGGAVGTVVGVAVAAGVGLVVNAYLTQQGLEGVRLVVPWAVVIGGVGGATMLALIAGTTPAIRAARLPAREAVSA
ncbi:MAG TPA: ABC transporter permease [Actinomycetota bacterium]|nr:ABC transporter permease [Actinomycetota bacterium]